MNFAKVFDLIRAKPEHGSSAHAASMCGPCFLSFCVQHLGAYRRLERAFVERPPRTTLEVLLATAREPIENISSECFEAGEDRTTL